MPPLFILVFQHVHRAWHVVEATCAKWVHIRMNEWTWSLRPVAISWIETGSHHGQYWDGHVFMYVYMYEHVCVYMYVCITFWTIVFKVHLEIFLFRTQSLRSQWLSCFSCFTSILLQLKWWAVEKPKSLKVNFLSKSLRNCKELYNIICRRAFPLWMTSLFCLLSFFFFIFLPFFFFRLIFIIVRKIDHVTVALFQTWQKYFLFQPIKLHNWLQIICSRQSLVTEKNLE